MEWFRYSRNWILKKSICSLLWFFKANLFSYIWNRMYLKSESEFFTNLLPILTLDCFIFKYSFNVKIFVHWQILNKKIIAANIKGLQLFYNSFMTIVRLFSLSLNQCWLWSKHYFHGLPTISVLNHK